MIVENRKILAVDDEPLILKQYEKLFSGQHARSFDLSQYDNGRAAAIAVESAAITENPFSVALIDMRMPPGIDGLETARRMRAADEDIQIIIVTAQSDCSIDAASQELSGKMLWFHKPFQGAELYQSVVHCCVSWNQNHELQQLKQTLSYRVNLQTRRLQEKVSSMEVLQRNSLSREQCIRTLKRENRTLRGYQDLRALLSKQRLPQQPTTAWSSGQEAPVRLLLVDSSAQVRDSHQKRMQETGFEVVTAASILEGFDQALSTHPEVALIDLQMSGGNGDELVRMLQQDSRTLGVLPLLFTAEGEEALAVQAGAVYGVVKSQQQGVLINNMELIRDYVLQHRKAVIKQKEALEADFQPKEEPENRRVLIVDDEEPIQEALSTLLQGVNAYFQDNLKNLFEETEWLASQQDEPEVEAAPTFKATTAASGELAIECVLEAQRLGQPFAVALIDMRMPPGMDGMEAAREIRQISPSTQIVIMTAYSDNSLHKMREVLGLNFSYIMKPYSEDMVLQRVVEGCEQWRINRLVSGSHNALLSLAEDMEEEITRRQETEQQLQLANHTKDEFLSSMSHELRTPLTTMIGYNELMAEEDGVSGSWREMAESSLLAGKTLLQLVNDILDMSKIRAGKFQLNNAPFNLQKMVTEVTDLMSVFGSQKSVAVKLVIDAKLSALLHYQWLGDEMRISQVLFNLLSNAVKFSNNRGEVTLRLSAIQCSSPYGKNLNNFALEVVDRGIGMSQEVLSRLFTPFEQADSTTSSRFGGTGLGLFISHQLVQLMGGAIRVISEEGEGSTFRVELPLEQTTERVESIDNKEQGLNIPQLQGRVLLAEDTIQLQRLGSLLIGKSGATVEIANNGLEALEMGQQHAYRLILMDMQMPEMDGIEATRRLRQLGIETPIVALTANAMPQHKEMFERAGCDGFLSKPIKRSLLYELLAKYLDPAPQGEQSTVTVPPAVEISKPEEDLTDLLDEEMMQEFWDYIADAGEGLEQAWKAQEWEQLRKIAHAIKGMGSSYGQSQMTQLAAQLQQLAVEGDAEAMAEPYTELLALIVNNPMVRAKP